MNKKTQDCSLIQYPIKNRLSDIFETAGFPTKVYLCALSQHFLRSLVSDVFGQHALKIARVTPFFKGGDPGNISNYRPISVLPFFSKILERIIYNRLYKYLTTEELLYSKQFGFQTGLSTEHAIVKLVDQIYESFEKDHYTLRVFIDLSKAFDTVDHTI